MSSRTNHRLVLFGDRDLLHVAAVAAAACVLTAGLVYVGYFVHVLRIARKASCVPGTGECVLVFGKHAPQGRMDRDFEARIDRTVSLWHTRSSCKVVLLGGGAQGELTEAEIARDGLHARGLPRDASLQLEAASRDTMQNLRNARELLGDAARSKVTLLSSRYHLARCALFARNLGFDAELCAAEPRLSLSPRMLMHIAGEAAYVCVSDLGTRWARLIGHRRMLARVT